MNSYSGWLDHMRDKHTQPKWHCWYCKTTSSSSRSFPAPEELQSHLEKIHQNEVTDVILPTLVKNSVVRPSHALQECPFCRGLPEEIEKATAQLGHESFLVRLEEHIKDHLVSVALILAPMEREESAGQSDSIQSEAQRGDRSEHDLNGDEDQFELECAKASCDCKKQSDLDLEQDISPGHDVREDVQALWDIGLPWKQIQDKNEQKYENDPLPLEFLHQDLGDYINSALRESEFPTPKNGYFVSRSALRAVTKWSVTRTLWRDSKSFESLDDSDRAVVEFISGKAPEIFAIGIYLDIEIENLRKMMRLFMTHDKTDGSLPISDAELETIWPGIRYRSRRRSFQDSQRIFRPQDFALRNKFSVIQIQPKVVLPILKSEHISQGRFGIVYKVVIHEEYLDINDPIRKV